MTKYEIMYMISPECKDIKSLQEKMHKIILDYKGEITKVTEWGLRDLAYPINHVNKAYYIIINIKGSLEAIEEFKRISKIESDIFRVFVLNISKEKNYNDKMVSELNLEINEKTEEKTNRNSEKKRFLKKDHFK